MKPVALVRDRKDLQEWVKKHSDYLKKRDAQAEKLREERRKLWADLHDTLVKSGDLPKGSTPDSVRIGFDDKFEVLKIGEPSDSLNFEALSKLVEALGVKK